jgi:hypothetical protein
VRSIEVYPEQVKAGILSLVTARDHFGNFARISARARMRVMTNAERLLLHALPRWAGITVITIKEPLRDMWISGELAGHHVDLPYDPDGLEELRKELLKDFVQAPATVAFGTGGAIQTTRDLVAAMVDIGQTPVPSTSAMLAALQPSDELATVTASGSRAAKLHNGKKTARRVLKRRSIPRPAAKKRNAGRKSTR